MSRNPSETCPRDSSNARAAAGHAEMSQQEVASPSPSRDAFERMLLARARTVPWHLRFFQVPPYWGLMFMSSLLFLVCWEAIVFVFGISSVVLPPPSTVLMAFAKYAMSGQMLLDLVATLRRTLLGLILGGVAGVTLGILMGWYGRVRAIFHPLMATTFPIPKIALLPLMIIWFGMGDTFQIVLVAVGVFFILTVNTIAGVQSIPRVTIMAAQNLGANDFQLLTKVVLPAAVPMIMAATRIAFAVALILIIAAEMIMSRDGIGNFLVFAGELLETEKIFAGLLLTGLVGLIGYAVIDFIEARLVPHKTHKGDA